MTTVLPGVPFAPPAAPHPRAPEPPPPAIIPRQAAPLRVALPLDPAPAADAPAVPGPGLAIAPWTTAATPPPVDVSVLPRAVAPAEAAQVPRAATVLTRRAQHAGRRRPSPAADKAKKGLGEALLTAAALLGLVVTGLTVFAMTTGLKPLVVRSGSMEPTIATGAMVLVRTIPPSEIEVGDVITVERPDHTRVMHRVLSVEHRGATAEVTLKGDANEDPDPVPVAVDTAGELVFTTPVVGRVSAFLASAKGGFVLGSAITAVLMTVLRRRPA